jgi:hypothetical protein
VGEEPAKAGSTASVMPAVPVSRAILPSFGAGKPAIPIMAGVVIMIMSMVHWFLSIMFRYSEYIDISKYGLMQGRFQNYSKLARRP